MSAAAIITVSDDDYHADTITDQPALSKSIAQILLDKSPAHAKAAHPRLNPQIERRDEKKYDIGTAAHRLFLEGSDARIVVVDAPDWRTNAAKAERDAAYAAGMTPLLAKDWQVVSDMAAAIREQADRVDCDPPLFQAGRPEQTIVWEEDGVTLKARLDWLRDDGRAIDDLKTTSASASPEAWPRTMLGIGGDLQAAMYLRGARHVLGVEPEFRFVAVETEPPYLLSVFAPAPDLLAIAAAKLEYAIGTWRECLRTGHWPGYPERVCWVSAPAWAESRWFDREARAA